MSEIALDAKVALVVAKVLRSRWTGVAADDAVCHALADIVSAAVSERTSDDVSLKREITTALERVAMPGGMLLDLDVHGGAIDLRGIVPSAQNRREVMRVVSKVAGVSEVRDHMIEIDPQSGAFLMSPSDSSRDSIR